MRVQVAIAHTPELLELLRRAGADTLTAELPENLGDYLLPEEVAEETEVLFCELPLRNIREMKKLRLIQISSTGYSQLFDLGLVERGVRVCNGRGEFDCPIAEWTAAMLVNLNRDLRSMLRNAEAGIWDRDARFQTELRGKTLGFFGYGSLARESARLAKAMGMRIYAYDRFYREALLQRTGDGRSALRAARPVLSAGGGAGLFGDARLSGGGGAADQAD